MTEGDALAELWWPIDRIGEAIEALALRSGLIRAAPPEPLVADPALSDDDRARWIDWAASRLGVEAVETEVEVVALDGLLRAGGPAILRHDRDGAPGFLALAKRARGGVALLDRELKRRIVPQETVRAVLAEPAVSPLRAEADRLLDLAGVSAARRSRAAAALLRERLAGERIGGVVLLRLPASAPVSRQARIAGVGRLFAALLAASMLLYALEIAGWRLIGTGALAGRVDPGWLVAWALILLTTVAVQTASAWLGSRFAIEIGRIVKARLLAGALALRPEAIRRGGVGRTIGRVIEAQALESLSLDGGLGVLIALVKLGFAAWVLAQGAAPATHLALLAAWTGLTGALAWRYTRRLAAWSAARLDLTDTLIEAMVGHRTRLAQESSHRREAADDGRMQAYLALSRQLDRAGLVGVSSLPSLWLLTGIAAVAPVFATNPSPSPVALAVSLGGLLLAQRGFAGIASGLSGLAQAGVAWRQVREIFAAARDGDAAPTFVPESARASGRLIDADALVYAYPGSDRRVIDGADLAIDRGDRLLLEGASGGGKSTLAALLTGLERPSSGLLLHGGLDRATLGEAWHCRAAAAPQFGDNHILSGTFAFNLLMGRDWPPSATDLAEAEALCHDLGLGQLLARMPGGLDQVVGETGWQLSHGERGRIYLARALLQRPELVVLDESFAALDPSTLGRCMEVARRNASTLLVIAHP